MAGIKEWSDYELSLPGNAACGGCPSTMALRTVGKALGENAVMIMTPSCAVASIGLLPKSAYDIPTLNICFAGAGVSASAVVNAFEIAHEKGRFEGEVPTVFNWTGDGGTYDIGLQSLSAAAERNDNILHFCYNNEAYSNTGIQRSGATMQFAQTTTTPGGKPNPKKNLAQIMLEHRVPYVATASIADLQDLYRKVEKAKAIQGFKYIEIHAPCFTAWKFAAADTVEIARLAVKSGAWLLWEANEDVITFQGATKQIAEGKKEPEALEEYLSAQGRFNKLLKSPDREENLAQLKADLARELALIKHRAAFKG
ncbi:MAG: pyruvate synthase subunit beta [Clostridiales Family XIII bacterium]|jgi:pyruvate ferredoxin oxidoreductase beta subunit|nr:pyruvate synthase subunit beta [Clostridiales Family XIII bacterium]